MAPDLITCAKGLTNAMVPAGGGTVQREDIQDADGCDPRRRIAHDRAVPRIHILVPSGGNGRGFDHVGLLSGSPASAQPRGKTLLYYVMELHLLPRMRDAFMTKTE